MIKIMIKEMKSFFRDPMTVFFTTLFPILLIFVLGTFLQNMDNSDNAVGEINIHFSSSKENMLDASLTNFLDTLSENGTINYQKTDDLNASLSMIDNGELDGSIELLNGKITLYTGIDSIKNRTLELLLNSFNRTSVIYISIAKINPEALNSFEMGVNKDYTSVKDLGVNRSMIDYYAIAMIVMTLFMSNLLSAANSVFEERNLKTNKRLFVSSANQSRLYIGRVIGNVFPALIQIVAIMVTSIVLFDAHYCKDLKGNITLILMFVICTLALISIGMFIGLVVKFPPTGIIMPISWSMLFISGIFSKEIYIEGLTELMPTNMIKQAAFDLTIFDNYEGAFNVILVSLALLIIFTLLGTAFYRKKGGEV